MLPRNYATEQIYGEEVDWGRGEQKSSLEWGHEGEIEAGTQGDRGNEREGERWGGWVPFHAEHLAQAAVRSPRAGQWEGLIANTWRGKPRLWDPKTSWRKAGHTPRSWY